MKPFLFFSSALFFIFLGFSHACGNLATTPQAPSANIGSTNIGASVFDKNCKVCHGADGRLGLNGAKDLSLSQLPINERINIITNGKNLMTPFGKLLSPAEIDSVATFTFQLQ